MRTAPAPLTTAVALFGLPVAQPLRASAEPEDPARWVNPFVGEVTTSPATDPSRCTSTFSHDRERAEPGHYGVALDNGAEVGLTVTPRTGVGRFTYPGGATSTLLVNTSGSISGTDDAEITPGRDSISGWATSGRFRGADHRYRIHFHAVCTNFSGWDVYRSEVRLLSLLAPAEAPDIARSMALFAEQGGAWDRWTVANGYTGVMVGDPYHVMVSTAYAFGARDFDASRALLLMLRGATQPTQGHEERPGLTDYLDLGYVPVGAPNTWGPPATTPEYTTADFAIAEPARRLGDGATWRTCSGRSQNWQNLFNPATGHAQPRDREGAFVEPFSPASPDNRVEGNAARYTWMVPHNVRGLVTAMGGDAAVRDRLDRFFTELNAGPEEPYAFLGNEPVMHTPWLYNWVGAPAKAQDVVRRAVDELFGPGPDGLSGNDDLGQMSSWYVWAALGLYPVIPGRAELVVNSPLFEEAVITRPGADPITLRTTGEGRYVSGLALDGLAQGRTWLPESLVARGGAVEFALSAEPTSWGTGPADAPPSFREGEAPRRAFVDPGRLVVPAGGTGAATLGAQDLSGRAAAVTWTARPPAGITVSPASGRLEVPAGARGSQRVELSVAPGAPERTHRVPIGFSDGQTATVTVLVAEPGSLRAAFDNTGTSPDDDRAAANGEASGTLTVTYDDGTTRDAAVGFSDWALGGAANLPPSFDNRVVATTPYRNSTGGESQEMDVHVFATAPIPLDPGRRVRSVTLPAAVTGGTLHAFALAVA